MGPAASADRKLQVKLTSKGYQCALDRAHADLENFIAESDEMQADKEFEYDNELAKYRQECRDLKANLLLQNEKVNLLEEALRDSNKKYQSLLCSQLPLETLFGDPSRLGETGALLNKSFTCVSVLVCDIVNFSKLSTLLPPADMVTLLDRIHVAVHSAFNDKEIYLMEGYSERCVAVSGLVEYSEQVKDSPSSLIERHSYKKKSTRTEHDEKQSTESQLLTTTHQSSYFAMKLATAALQLMSNINSVKIPRYPRDILQFRIALHCGSCQGGVVGLQNLSIFSVPHYHLFGPAIDFTRYLCSTGLALQIRVSADCHSFLKDFSDFLLERCPDYTSPKGDTITSYWLLDKLGMEINLPSQEDAISLSEYKEMLL